MVDNQKEKNARSRYGARCKKVSLHVLSAVFSGGKRRLLGLHSDSTRCNEVSLHVLSENGDSTLCNEVNLHVLSQQC